MTRDEILKAVSEGADPSCADLSYGALRGADLRGANLSCADLTRDEHLEWCKRRALEILATPGPHGGAALAASSMISDLGKWDGGQLYDPQMLVFMMEDAMRGSVPNHDDMRAWINGFK